MPRSGEKTRRRIVDAAYELFYRGGFARAGVDDVAEAAGVTKRTLYYHFESKDALLAAMLEAQHELMLATIQRWAGGGGGDPASMVDTIFSRLAGWARKPGWQGSGFTRAAVELADLPGHPARAAARRHKAAVERWLADELAHRGAASAPEVARQVALLLEGSMVLILVHGDTSYAATAAAAARRLVEAADMTARGRGLSR
jgi:AcrR family transcriptional regulator